MPRPTDDLPDWASDANYPSSADPWSGEPTKIEPAGGDITGGAVPKRTFPAQRFNWFLNLIGKWVRWLDESLLGLEPRVAIGSGTLAEMAALDAGQSPAGTNFGGSKFFVPGYGWYSFSDDGALAPDETWIVTGVGGYWVHELLVNAQSSTLGIAAVGPVPDDGGAGVSGKIRRSVQHYPVIVQQITAPFTTSNNQPIATPMTSLDNIGGGTLGAVQVGDVIRGTFSAAVYCANSFRLAVCVTQDNGTTYAIVSPRIDATQPVKYPAEVVIAGDRAPIHCSFVHEVTASPAPSLAAWAIRAQGGGDLEANIGSVLVEVIRP